MAAENQNNMNYSGLGSGGPPGAAAAAPASTNIGADSLPQTPARQNVPNGGGGGWGPNQVGNQTPGMGRGGGMHTSTATPNMGRNQPNDVNNPQPQYYNAVGGGQMGYYDAQGYQMGTMGAPINSGYMGAPLNQYGMQLNHGMGMGQYYGGGYDPYGTYAQGAVPPTMNQPPPPDRWTHLKQPEVSNAQGNEATAHHGTEDTDPKKKKRMSGAQRRARAKERAVDGRGKGRGPPAGRGRGEGRGDRPPPPLPPKEEENTQVAKKSTPKPEAPTGVKLGAFTGNQKAAYAKMHQKEISEWSWNDITELGMQEGMNLLITLATAASYMYKGKEAAVDYKSIAQTAQYQHDSTLFSAIRGTGGGGDHTQQGRDRDLYPYRRRIGPVQSHPPLQARATTNHHQRRGRQG